MIEETIRILTSEKLRLEMELAKVQSEIAKVTGALEALEGKEPATNGAPKLRETGPSVRDYVRELITQHLPAGATFDSTSILSAALKRFGSGEILEKIRRGVHPAFTVMLRHQEITRVPGGFQRVPDIR